ncbi:hypothetical protein GEMRC1_012893 [Eukaryota sp. GEM-RC1]
MQLLLSSSDSEDEILHPSTRTYHNVQSHRSISFVKELPPIPVYLFSLRDDADEVSDYIRLFHESIPSENPFIAVDCKCRQNTLDVIQLGTPSISMVIQIHQVKQLNDDVCDLLTNPDITKVINSKQEDIKLIMKMWEANVSPVFDIESYFQGICKIHKQRLGKTNDEPDLFSDSLVVTSAHGYTLLCTKGRKTSMSNWSSDSLSEEQTEYAALDAFLVAFIYYLKTSGPTLFLLLNKNYSLFDGTSTYPFTDTLSFPDRESFLLWLTDARPFCCDVHDLSDNLTKKSISSLSSLSFSQISSQCVTLFASVLSKIFDDNNNIIILTFPTQNKTSFVNLCTSLLVPLFLTSNSIVFMLFSIHLSIRSMDCDSLEVIQQLEVTKDMLEVNNELSEEFQTGRIAHSRKQQCQVTSPTLSPEVKQDFDLFKAQKAKNDMEKREGEIDELKHPSEPVNREYTIPQEVVDQLSGRINIALSMKDDKGESIRLETGCSAELTVKAAIVKLMLHPTILLPDSRGAFRARVAELSNSAIVPTPFLDGTDEGKSKTLGFFNQLSELAEADFMPSIRPIAGELLIVIKVLSNRRLSNNFYVGIRNNMRKVKGKKVRSKWVSSALLSRVLFALVSLFTVDIENGLRIRDRIDYTMNLVLDPLLLLGPLNSQLWTLFSSLKVPALNSGPFTLLFSSGPSPLSSRSQVPPQSAESQCRILSAVVLLFSYTVGWHRPPHLATRTLLFLVIYLFL